MTAAAQDRLRAADWLATSGIQAVFSALEQKGDAARAVGGAVRNTLLGHPVPDIDIATTAPPDEVMRRAEAAGLKPIGTGLDHGTVTVISDGYPYEVTTLREDVETFGRQARVVFGRDWSKDAWRRDFTMNALYVDRSGCLHDPLGGLQDCLDGRVRFIGNPDDRLREDYLRILRFFRIHAAYGSGDLDPDGLGACLRQRDGLRHLSAERIGHEIRRLLQAPLAPMAVRCMNEAGLWEIATGGIALVEDYAALRRLDAIAPETRDPELGLVVLSGFVHEDLDRICERLRLSNAQGKRMQRAWAAKKQYLQSGDLPGAAAMVYQFGRQAGVDGLLAAWAKGIAANVADLGTFKTALSGLRAQDVPEFPLKGADLIAQGHAPGPKLGALLKELEGAWQDSGFSLSKSHLLAKSQMES